MTLGQAPTTVLETSWANPRVVAVIGEALDQIIVTAIGIAATRKSIMKRYDFQSADAFGYLLASDSFNMTLNSINTLTFHEVAWKLFYRFVDIPLSEFVGLVQSTQQS